MFKLILFFIFNLYRNDCLDGEVLQGLGFNAPGDTPEIMDQDICGQQFKQYGSCVDTQQLKQMMEQQQQELIDGLDVDTQIEGVLGSYQQGLEGTNLEDEFGQVKTQYMENKKKCGNGLAKVNNGVLCLIASGQASQYTQISGSEITVDVNASEVEESGQKCEPVVEAICLAGAGQSIEQDMVADDSNLQAGNQGLQNACSNIKKDKTKLMENFGPQKIKKVMPKKEEMEKVKEKVDDQKEQIQEKIKDFKGGEKIARPKPQDNGEKLAEEMQKQDQQKDGVLPQGDQKPPQDSTQQKPTNGTNDSQMKPPQDSTQQKPTNGTNDTQMKPPQTSTQLKPSDGSTDTQQKPPQDSTQQKPSQQITELKPAQQTNTNTQQTSPLGPKPPQKKTRRLQSTYNINIRQTENGAPVVSIADSSGIQNAYKSTRTFCIMTFIYIILFQII